MSRFEKFFNARSVYRIVRSLEWDDEKLYKDGTFEHYWWMRAETWLGMHRASRWEGFRTFLRAAPAAMRGDVSIVVREMMQLLRENATQLLGLWEETYATFYLKSMGRVNPWTGETSGSSDIFDLETQLGREAGLELRSLEANIKERMDRYG